MLKVHKSQLLLKANMPILFMEKYLGVIFQKKIKFENQKIQAGINFFPLQLKPLNIKQLMRFMRSK